MSTEYLLSFGGLLYLSGCFYSVKGWDWYTCDTETVCADAGVWRHQLLFNSIL
jgi:hypothetical protein